MTSTLLHKTDDMMARIAKMGEMYQWAFTNGRNVPRSFL